MILNNFYKYNTTEQTKEQTEQREQNPQILYKVQQNQHTKTSLFFN